MLKIIFKSTNCKSLSSLTGKVSEKMILSGFSLSTPRSTGGDCSLSISHDSWHTGYDVLPEHSVCVPCCPIFYQFSPSIHPFVLSSPWWLGYCLLKSLRKAPVWFTDLLDKVKGIINVNIGIKICVLVCHPISFLKVKG